MRARLPSMGLEGPSAPPRYCDLVADNNLEVEIPAKWHMPYLPQEVASPPPERSAPLITRSRSAAHEHGVGDPRGRSQQPNGPTTPTARRQTPITPTAKSSSLLHSDGQAETIQSVVIQGRTLRRRWSSEQQHPHRQIEGNRQIGQPQHQHFKQGKGPWYSMPIEPGNSNTQNIFLHTNAGCPVISEEDCSPLVELGHGSRVLYSLEDQINLRRKALKSGRTLNQDRAPRRQERLSESLKDEDSWLTPRQPGTTGAPRRNSNNFYYKLLNDLDGGLEPSFGKGSVRGMQTVHSEAHSSSGDTQTGDVLVKQADGVTPPSRQRTGGTPTARLAPQGSTRPLRRVRSCHKFSEDAEPAPISEDAEESVEEVPEGLTQQLEIRANKRVPRVRFADMQVPEPDDGKGSKNGQDGTNQRQFGGRRIQRARSEPAPKDEANAAVLGQRTASLPPLRSQRYPKAEAASTKEAARSDVSRLQLSGLHEPVADGAVKHSHDITATLDDSWVTARVGKIALASRHSISSASEYTIEPRTDCSLAPTHVSSVKEKGVETEDHANKGKSSTLEEIWGSESEPRGIVQGSRTPRTRASSGASSPNPGIQRATSWGLPPFPIFRSPLSKREGVARIDNGGSALKGLGKGSANASRKGESSWKTFRSTRKVEIKIHFGVSDRES